MNDEYNCPPVCPKCQRCHRGECEPKPQTPLTDALIYDHKRITTIFSDVVDFARSLEIKLQEAQSKATKWDDLQTLIKCDAHAQGKDTPMDVLDQLVKQLTGLKKAEHQRDEAAQKPETATFTIIMELCYRCIATDYTDEADVKDKMLHKYYNEPSFQCLIKSLNEVFSKLERERDEAMKRYNIAISVDEETFLKVRAERDQLIKVCDELASCCGQFSKDGGASAIHAYSLLPHVQSKKGNKQ